MTHYAAYEIRWTRDEGNVTNAFGVLFVQFQPNT